MISISDEIPRAKINIDEITEPIVNTGDQSEWNKNPDNCTQGERLETTTSGRDCPRGPGCDLCLTRAELLIAIRDGIEVGKVAPCPESLFRPFRWRKRKNVFATPTGDLFHKNIPEGYIRDVLDVFNHCPQHNFTLTTKRENRLHVISGIKGSRNVYIGVSIEAQKYMDRADALLDLPRRRYYRMLFLAPIITHMVLPRRILRGVDGIICTPERGGQGRHPRPCPEEWLADLIKQVKSFNSNLPLFLDMKFDPGRVHRLGGKFMEVPKTLME